VVFLQGEVLRARIRRAVNEGVGGRGGPEHVVVVREEGEEDAEEKACCYHPLSILSSVLFAYAIRTADDEESRKGRGVLGWHDAGMLGSELALPFLIVCARGDRIVCALSVMSSCKRGVITALSQCCAR